MTDCNDCGIAFMQTAMCRVGQVLPCLDNMHLVSSLGHRQMCLFPVLVTLTNCQPTFVSLSRNLDAELYVKSVHAYDAYLAGRADIRYDFKQVVLFILSNTMAK